MNAPTRCADAPDVRGSATLRAMHPMVERRSRHYVTQLDRFFPGRVVGLYVVGSSAMGAFDPDRSDIDLVVVLDGNTDGDCRRIRSVHRASALRTFPRAVFRLRSSVPGVCNAVFVDAGEISRPVRSIRPIGSHVGLRHTCGTAFDVNPVVWKTLRDQGIAIRGPEPSTIGLDAEEDRLREWNRDNLRDYWQPFAQSLQAGSAPLRYRLRPGWTIAWVTTGPARLHHTIATGEVISKDQAGEYALEVFDRRWHPIIRAGLAARRGETPTGAFRDRATMVEEAGRFGLHVVEDADRLP